MGCTSYLNPKPGRRSLRALTRVPAIVLLAGVFLWVPARAEPTPTGDVIAQMFGWNWRSIGRECRETLGPLGYGAVQTAPAQEHSRWPERGYPWWSSYSPVSHSLDSRWGTRAELAEMVRSCHGAGVRVYVDAVVNNMSGVRGCDTGSAGAEYCHFSYPSVPYSRADFHHCGTPHDAIQDFRDRYHVQHCETFELADLATEKDHVRDRIADYLNDLLALGVDGFRIDSAKHVAAEDLSAIFDRLDRPAYIYQEVVYGVDEAVRPEEYLGNGDAIDLRYAAGLSAIFRHGRLRELGNFGSELPSASSVVFVDNHDTKRSRATLSQLDGERYVLASAFVLAWPYGRLKVLSDYVFRHYDQPPPSDPDGRAADADCADPRWLCEHSAAGIAGLIGFRRAVGDAPVRDWADDGANLISFGRGEAGYLILNGGTSDARATFRTALPAGTYCDVMHGLVRNGSCTGPVYTVDHGGRLHAEVPALSGIALHVGSAISGG
ncbi:alpha-amylase family protein [Nocardia sp. NPDC050435]|uniref:alpha-amylase n=1 Tax=Nocardia sp. NPDC050435 TaxID=3155040 RepID=UPI00340120C6